MKTSKQVKEWLESQPWYGEWKTKVEALATPKDEARNYKWQVLQGNRREKSINVVFSYLDPDAEVWSERNNEFLDWYLGEEEKKELTDLHLDEVEYVVRPFDLKTAQEHPEWARTRDGREVRILCTDAKGDYPIVALVSSRDLARDVEFAYSYNMQGMYSASDLPRDFDLVLFRPKPKTVQHSGWVAVYLDDPDDLNDYTAGKDGIWSDEDECRENNPDALAIARVTWEEEED